MAATVTWEPRQEGNYSLEMLQARGMRIALGSIAFDSSYPTGGEAITPMMNTVRQAFFNPQLGYQFRYDKDNDKIQVFAALPAPVSAGTVKDDDAAATAGHAIYVVPLMAGLRVPDLAAESSATGLLTDSDSAASDGVQIYVVVDDPNWSGTYQLGHLEFVSPTNVNGTCTIASGAETLTLFDDDDAATNGVEVRAVAAGGGLEATTADSKDILIPLSSGKFIHINHATTGAAPEIYFDEDAANTYERLLAVMVDNADEPYSLFVDTGEKAPFTIQQGPRLAALVTVGPKPFTYTVGSGGPELTIPSRPDAASLPGAMALYVQAAGAGFNADNFGKEDVYVPLSNGEFLLISYAASPAGVQVYGQPEQTNSYEMLTAVIADDADETFTVATDRSMRREANSAPQEVASGTDLSALDDVEFMLIGND